MNNIKHIRRRSIGTFVLLLILLCFIFTPALLFGNFDFGSSSKKPIDEQELNLSTNYLFKGTTYAFNLDDFYDDTNLYKIYTGAKFQTEAFNGTSLEWTGVINNDTVIPVNNTETQYGKSSGHYPATYSFEEFADGTEGYDITGFTDYYVAGEGTSAKIISEIDDHKKVLELDDQSGTGAVAIRHNFDYTEVNSIIEFWLACSITTGYRNLYLYIYDQNSINIARLVLTNDDLQYDNGTGDYTIYTFSANKFFHVKMVLDDTADTYDIYVNEDLKESDINYNNPSTTNAYKFYLSTRASNTGYKIYFDALGYSGDPEYTPSGHHPGTYSFTNELVGTSGLYIDFVDQITGTAEIISDYKGHKKVLNFTHDAANSIINILPVYQTSGTLEFYLKEVLSRTYFRIRDIGGALLFEIMSYPTYVKVYYGDGAGGNVYSASYFFTTNFPHFKVSFDCGVDTFSVWCEDFLMVNNVNFKDNLDLTEVYQVRTYNSGASDFYLDAIGYSWDPYYNIGDNLYPSLGNLYPDNINMIKGSYDYTDNMKVNDASYTTFTSTHFGGYSYETPSQWDDFTFTEGSGDTIGELETIDADWSIIISTHTEGTRYEAPNQWGEFSFTKGSGGATGELETDNDADYAIVDSSVGAAATWRYITACTMAQGSQSGVIANAKVDDGNYFTLTSVFIMAGVYMMTTNNLGFNIAPDGSEQYISYNLWSSAPNVKIEINGGTWKTGNPHLNADDQNHAGVSSVSFTATGTIAFTVRVYYFRMDGVDAVNAELDIDATWIIPNTIQTFYYDYRTTISLDCDLDIYNWDTTLWLELQSNTGTGWITGSYGLTDPYINVSNGVKIRFQTAGYAGNFDLELDQLSVSYIDDPALIDVQIDMQITDIDLSSIGYFKFSHKTNISTTMDLDIWNWDTTTWFEIESVDNFATFDDDSFTLGLGSDYVSGTFQVRIRFQASNPENDFELLIDRFRLDYLTIPVMLEFTIIFSFAGYNEDLLFMTIQSWQKTNKSQTIVFKIWNYDTGAYVQISSSSDTSFTKKEYNTTSPNDFLSPTGTVKLYWIGSNSTNDFELHIDYLYIQIYYKLDLVHEKSFDTNGIYRYRWCIIGSIHYTQWVNFEVIDPVPNFHAISESDNPTRWILQGAGISPIQNFTDDINPSSDWDLYDVSPVDFNKYIPDLTNYLLDNYVYYGSSYISPAQWGDFAFTKGAGNTVGELETNDADYAIVDAGYTLSGESLLGYIVPDGDILTSWYEGDATPHWSKIDEAKGDMDGDGGNIRESTVGVDDRWSFDDGLTIPAGEVVTKIVVHFYMTQEILEQSTGIKYTTSFSGVGYIAGTTTYLWRDDTNSGLSFSQANLDAFWMNVEPDDYFTGSAGWVDIETVYVDVYTSLKQYSVDYTMTWDVDDPISMENFSYDYKTTFAVDTDLDIYNWDTTNWLELESNTDTNWHTDTYVLTDPYISGSDEIKVRFQSTLTTTDFDMELDQIALVYNSIYTISKKHNDTIAGYIYMQTNTTEIISLNSSVYGTNYTLSSGDYFTIDFQTSSDSQINIILLRDGEVNETLIVSSVGNTNFNRHTVQIPVDKNVEFDQLRFNSTFWDTDYFRCYDIKTYNYNLTGDYVNFIVGSKNDYEIYLTPDDYNLRIHDPYDGELKVNRSITISSGYNYYIYEPTETIQCRLTLFTLGKENYLQFENYHIIINRSLNDAYFQYDLLYNIFCVDIGTDIHIEVYDRFNNPIKNATESAEPYIDLEIEVYSLQIKNLQIQQTTVDINSTLYNGILLSGESIYFMLAKDYYQIGYYDTNDVYKHFLIYLNSNQAYELNRSKICFLAFVNQKGEHLYFDNYKTYINDSLIYENVFYREIGDDIGIEVKDIYGISIKNQTYTVVSGDNYIPVVLTLYSLKVMSQQLCFNHINITRDPNYYESEYYWSEWIAPSEIIEFKLFAGYYKINLTNNEAGSSSYYSYTLNGDDILLIGSNNTIYNVLVNIANVNATIGNQITNVQIDLTNQNSNINNTIINIEINLNNLNSTLGTLLINIDTAISNINSSIISEIVSLGTEINNINSTLSNQMLTITTDISNLDSSIQSQFVTLGVDISNINGSIINQILALGVDITNINTSLSNQILSLEVDISNINALIIEQILLVIADIENIETVIDDQTLVILADITNLNSTLLNQMVYLGVDITNINATIINQILELQVDLTNINSSISNLLTTIDLSIINLQNDIGSFYAFTNNSFINLNNVMNTSFIFMENNIISINQSISNLVIGVSNDVYLINGTISTMITQLETNLLLMNISIDTALFDLGTTLNLLGSNITSNFILLNNSIYLNNLNINDSRIAMINNLLLINNTISTLISEVYSAVYLINNSIYTAVVDLGTYLSLMNNNIYGNLSIVLEMNEFLTEIYQMTMFSDLLNWTNIGLNTSLITTQIDVWTFINNYVNQSVEVHLRYQDLIEKLAISADDFRDQWLPNKDVEYNLWSVVDGKYEDEWKTLDPDNKTVNFGFYEEKVPDFPSFDNTSITIVLIILIFIGVIGLSTYFVYKYNKRVQNLKVAYTRQHTIEKDLIEGAVRPRSSRMKRIK